MLYKCFISTTYIVKYILNIISCVLVELIERMNMDVIIKTTRLEKMNRILPVDGAVLYGSVEK